MRTYALFAVLLLAGGAGADAPPETAPPPRPALPPALPPVVTIPEVVYPRGVSAYARWQYYAVDRKGTFRPAVVQAPGGAFYLYSGRPFPWVSTQPRLVMPYATD